MNPWITRGAQVAALSAGLVAFGATGASAATDLDGGGNVVGNGGDGGAGVYNEAGSVNLINLGFGGRGGNGGQNNVSDGGGDDAVGNGGNGGVGIYNAPGSYSLVNVSIDGQPGTSVLDAGSLTGGNFLPSTPVSRRTGLLGFHPGQDATVTARPTDAGSFINDNKQSATSALGTLYPPRTPS
ncbi:hypothetical protein [Cryptosporangium sp. NPDC048952]|uniref:hypothetical protein n=1 Tax=Cryptosporangium sp. NPDC048952 TaxID=3363961 RepID=UPI0037213D42